MGVAGNVYAFDLGFPGGVLVGDLDEVQPSPLAVSDVINLRWDTVSNSCPLLDGVAYVELPAGYEKRPQQSRVLLGHLGEGERYFWDHTLVGYASAIVLLLPREWTLSRDVMPPISCNAPGLVRISAKEYKGRIAILFIVEPNGVHNLRTTWQIERFKGPVSTEIQRINWLSQGHEKPIHIGVDQPPGGSREVNADSSQKYLRSHLRRHRFLWGTSLVLLIAATLLWLGSRRLIPGFDEIPGDLKSEYVGSEPHHKPVVIVFVHGIFGSKNDTWTNKGESFPLLLAADPSLQSNTDVFLFEFFSPTLSQAGSIVELADQLRGALHDHGVFRDHKRVVFLTHSMGGLIVRQFVTSNTETIPKIAMFYFYATPTNGAELAGIARHFSGNPQLRGMVPLQDSDLLQSIQQRWLSVPDLVRIPSYCAYETLPTDGVYVVSQASARGLCNRPLDPITADHINIVKPAGRDDPRYTRFVSAIQESVPEASTSATAPEPADRNSGITRSPCKTPFHPDHFSSGNIAENGQTAYQANAGRKLTSMNDAARDGSAMFEVKKLGMGDFENSTTTGNGKILKSDSVDHLTAKNNIAYGDSKTIPSSSHHSFNVGDWFDFLENYEQLVVDHNGTDTLEKKLHETLETEWAPIPQAERSANRKELERVLSDLRGRTFNAHYRDWPPTFVERPCD
jgi:pimeloyl-ACP methyl ester carboxylesterase